MRKTNFALRLAALFALIAFASACVASLIFAYFFYRDPSRMLVAAQKYFPAYAAASLGVFAFFRAALGKPQKTINRIESGEELGLEERLQARARLARLPRYASLANGICFGLLPLAAVISWIATGQGDLSEDLLTMLFFVAIGLSCSSQQQATGEIHLRDERAKLKIYDTDGIKAEMRIGTRLIYTSLTSVFLTATSLIIAAMGIYREYARWVASKGADAVSSASKAQYGAAEGTVLLQLLFLVVLTMAWSSVGILLSTKNLRGQLALLEERMREIASGSSDLGQRAAIGQNDDVGRLGSSFNKVLAKVQALLGSVKGTSASVSESSHRLDQYVAQAESSLASFEEASDRVRESAESQAQAVGRGREIVARLSSSIEKIAADVQTQASQVAQSSASVEEMAANIASVNKSAEKAGELTVSLSGLSDSGLEVVRDTLKGMVEIKEAAASVRDIIGSISKIASQTNLLAMNAAIEAAHAGAAGSGFAVVANEVRGLAETSAKSTKEIVALMKAMEAKIVEGSKRAEKAEAAFADIAGAVGGTSEIVHSIASAMAEQGEAAREILVAMKNLTDATASIESQAKSQESHSAEITSAIEDIVRKAQSIEESIQEQAGSLQALGRVVRMVSEESGVNKAGVESLDASVGGFTV